MRRISPLHLLFLIAILLLPFSLARASTLVDAKATRETQILAHRLRENAPKGFLFGQQNATTEGVNWRDQGTSFCGDVCKVSKLHPAVYGWDYSDVYQKDEAAKDALRAKMRQAYEAGGINTISWHFVNPVTGGDPKDKTPACERIREGMDLNKEFLTTLDSFAEFLSKLKTRDGVPIPVIFRPWHEANADWFWWGFSACNVDTLKSLWGMTVRQLRDQDQIHQLLYAFSPNWYPANGMIDWPGDEYVDIVGFDFYFFKPIAWLQRASLTSQLLEVVNVAREKDKIAALTEVGYESLPYAEWWTNVFLNTLISPGIGGNISYSMVWRNENTDHFYAPYPGQASVPDFLKMTQDSRSLFLEDIQNQSFYGH